MSSHSSTLSPWARPFAPQSAKDFCKHISNAGYGTASFFIMATGPLQKHFQYRLWHRKFPHHGDRTIVKIPSMNTFMFIAYGAASLQTT
jgi:hypothetical protein